MPNAPGVRVRYVVGFAFDSSRSNVLLIRKNRPQWQAGLLNGVGGKVEPGESPDRAMEREFKEETGFVVDAWRPVALLVSGDAQIEFFSHTTSLHGDEFRKAFTHSPTDERLEVWPVRLVAEEIAMGATIPNLSWLIPLAAYGHDRYERPVFVEVPT